VSSRYDPAARIFAIDIEQSVPPTPSESRKRLMHIPLAFGLVGEDGMDMTALSVEGAVVEGGVIHVRKRKHTVTFSGIASRPALSLNRGFSAPITLSVQQKAEDLLFLARRDSDLFSRWQASNTLFTDAIIAACRGIRGGKQPEFSADLLALAGWIADDDTLEPAFRALALTLPGESDIARELGSDIDPDAIFAARTALANAIASANRQTFQKLHAGLIDTGDFSPDAASAGRRALRNIVLDYLALLPGGCVLAARHFNNATNMTDRAAALSVLVHRHGGSAEAAAALASFERAYGGDALVMDKWFQIQAAAPGAGTVDTVKALTAHPAFSMNNPNRVRALIGAMANASQTGFHRADGEGYEYLAGTVVDIDRRNPQLAARLATAFRSWRSLEPGRKAKAREALLSIAGADKLSADLRDIVERTLA
jgi:aminopeptidase N